MKKLIVPALAASLFFAAPFAAHAGDFSTRIHVTFGTPIPRVIVQPRPVRVIHDHRDCCDDYRHGDRYRDCRQENRRDWRAHRGEIGHRGHHRGGQVVVIDRDRRDGRRYGTRNHRGHGPLLQGRDHRK